MPPTGLEAALAGLLAGAWVVAGVGAAVLVGELLLWGADRLAAALQ